MSFCNFRGFFSATLLASALRDRELIKEIKSEKEYTGNTAATIVDPVLIVESEVN